MCLIRELCAAADLETTTTIRETTQEPLQDGAGHGKDQGRDEGQEEVENFSGLRTEESSAEMSSGCVEQCKILEWRLCIYSASGTCCGGVVGKGERWAAPPSDEPDG